MKDWLKAMATFMKKFKRKRRVSTELHSRWGDVSITYPTQGSWNQWDQSSGFVANAIASTNIQPEANQQYPSAGPLRQPSSSASSRRSRSTGIREHQVGDAPSFPTGYFDQNIRRRVGDRDTNTPPGPGLGLRDLRRGPNRRPSSSIDNDECTTDESCEEEEEREERDTPGPRIELSPREYGTGDVSHRTRDDPEDFDTPARSPPLSVTSRMRRCSLQSCATEPTTSVSGGNNSRRTSFTAASSISAPSMPPCTPQVAYNALKQPPFPEKRYPPRTKHREPESAPPQEMVPSYDELYG
ncbi:hypothetical protein DTO013E5_4651 [Penicillium roqueforti]|uniref:Genomic scaffold, ProqFM164S01 n=1 Tax=Penicillium roqueforti (strain FM164) TaxID=1365484 RepID=W6QA32_PENRF|nr:uncharacterized protein LCP9604111_6319 [Penicillium roqueforti]CDM26647.1 unnamed protein product [Penicillium roqueforti FM164]KAF9247620.1 hypothetical protein LCP9604111_6319 [Penicillium roqueforti]KAI2676800.1 hypothetical protein CBS147355_5902 [Penicillium roqueforti]KAI2683674.1 hypothetical protein LCP963914a_6075 [Penicillium roqueforti]KAI2703119.1 hypothetical protein CBS147372_3434 [Penicillium roqueforti]